MNRVLVLVGVALMSVGCAVSADDPVEQFPERDPNANTANVKISKAGELEDRTLNRENLDSVSLRMKVDYDLGTWEVPNVPLPER